MVAMVDDDDFEILCRHKWHYKNTGYASRTKYIYIGKNNQTSKGIFMHREIMRVDSPEITVDHINGNKLDNRKSNLRIVNKSMNALNSDKAKGWVRRKDRKGNLYPYFIAQIIIDGHRETIGRFPTAKDATDAYNKRRKECLQAITPVL